MPDLLAASSSSPNPLFPPNWTEVIVGGLAFFIVFGVLWKFLLPRIMTTLSERTDRIEGGLERAAEAQAEAARLREQSREDGAAIIAEMREQARAEARRTTEAARAQIEAVRQQAFSSL